MTSRSISMPEPENAQTRRSARKETVYAVGQIPALDMEFYQNVGSGAEKVSELTIPARDGGAFEVPAGHLFRIVSVEGSQVGDFNLWNSDNLSEHFYSGKTRAIHATHISTGDRLWSSMPYLRPMATITYDSLGWYGWDSDGCGIHDVIGTRCDPYTRRMITGEDYDHCCHSNLVRALSAFRKISAKEAEGYVHDVMNVFMCTGFDVESHEYIKKASPVRPGDFIEFFAEINLLGALSACPGGDCGPRVPGQTPKCYPLKVEILRPAKGALNGWKSPEPSPYKGKHGMS
ncbi:MULTISPECIES: urea carboxylase-associated family protein [Bradyrhizobium]|uniref:DUF1989 domain-containing protein n=3 Tax=Bradyrhizobium TaxID=374 RepID=A0AAE6CC94_9BRAD|nr:MULTISPECIES: DUF1989 domain-containing protein [Bradyrhizobium]MCG2629332.1 DUF1989 domain-containing protein [Bradyrhizobium zhengyangense]MCG2644613.1 DUF1989 domain-containing protein [Bradyrhizobium zhengyangense]MCG2670846.1 DUF1989 domain-containing protein [Bradyrhizobium zhengyangense]MDN4984478.1 DUF1989 domain-containing protein [Bradyrhizobium sp. WYCCWR 13022]MDN5002470.1 DUF1989 domain-containing protein [Bradyrhizobium sp. WYCCWR 12677]